MKIVHKSKKPVPPPPQVAEFIVQLLRASNEELVNILAELDHWRWPRSDLNAWIKILNKFDAIVEEIIVEYDLDNLQLKPFAPSAKHLITEILRFERLLMENSTNRKTYSSYDRLNSLLFTSDLDILLLALNLLLRPAQQYSAQPAVAHALSLSSSRLQSLAKKWSHVREYGSGLAELVSAKGEAEVESLPIEAREVNMTFYRTDVNEKGDQKPESALPVVPETPRKGVVPTPSSGAVTIHIDERDVVAKPAMEVLADAIKTYHIPDKEKFEVLSRIRVAAALEKGHREEREKLLTARLLAIAIYCHAHPESRTTSTLFVYEPDLITHIAELLQVDNGVPVGIQTAAIAALDALARYRAKLQEVLTAVNAAINHGILMGLFRKTVNDLPQADSTIPQSFVEALLGFLTYIVSHQSGSSMVVGAGLIPLLIQLIDNKSASRLTTTSKTMQLLDNVLYSASTGFHLFTAARGLETLVERIEYEVEYDIRTYGDVSSEEEVINNPEVPIGRIAVLKHMLRSVHRMMQSAGTAEGLRNLINMSLLQTVKKIIEFRGLFGATILPFAINIMTTFVHNEPTSLNIIQEAGLPEAFYNTIEAGIEPAIEVIQAIPNAIGALCLNEVGQSQLARRPSIIPSIFALFTSERHVKILNDKENAVLIGTAIDELIRHHPSLKVPVFSALKSALTRVEEHGLEYQVPPNITQWYQLRPLSSEVASSGDVPMDIDEQGSTALKETNADVDDDIADEEQSKSHDSVIVSYIDVLGRFLEGLFQHTPHCRDFINSTDGLIRIGRMTSLPCLPYDFANSVASDSMVQVLRTMAEVATNETIQHLSQLVKESLEETSDFWKTRSLDSKLLSYIDVTDDDVEVANIKFRKLVTLHIRITLLSDVFSTTGYAHGRAAIGLLQTLMNNTSPEVIADLGTLHRASIWENIVFNAGLASKGIDLTSSPGAPLEGVIEPLGIEPISLEDSEVPATSATSTTNGVQPEQPPSGTSAPASSTLSNPEPRIANAAAIKHLTHGLPNILAPFFQAMVKTFHARRNPDSAQRKQIQESSKIVADVMLKHLQYESGQERSLSFAYHTVVLGLFSILLVEERPTSTILHTIQLQAFHRIGGLDYLFSTSDMFTARIAEVANKPDDSRSDVEKRELIQAYGGLKVVLHLLHPILSAKLVVESGQSHLIATKDKKETDPDYFEPHQFLIKLRVVALPLITSLWAAPWLLQAPVGVTRAVVRTLLEVMKAEGEEAKGEPIAEVLPVHPIVGVPTRPPGPDENRIRMLTDMGFPRSAAERALIRTGNNVNAATELLLAQPFPLPPDPQPEASTPSAETPPVADGAPETAAEPTANAEAPVTVGNIVDEPVEPVREPTPHPTSSEIEELTPSGPPGRTTEEWRAILNEGRESLSASLSRRGLNLIDEHQQLLFDLYPAFTKASPRQKEAIQQLIEDVNNFSPHAYDVQEQPLANRCRLLALVLCESPSTFDEELRSTLTGNLLALLSSIVIENPPKWLAGHLLVLEALFTLSDEPRSITLPKEGELIEPQPITVGPTRLAARQTVFKLALRLLSLEELHSDEFLSVLRLFVLFTRNREMADQFIQGDGLVMLFKRLRTSSVNGGSSYIAIILRHLVEDPTTIRGIMQQNLKRYFSQARNNMAEVGACVKNCSSMALRDSEIFIDTTKSLCRLTQPFSTSKFLTLQKGNAKVEKPDDGSEMQVDNVHPPATPAMSTATIHTAEATIHLLISELMTSVKEINESTHQSANSSDTTHTATGVNAASTAPKASTTQGSSTVDSNADKPDGQGELQDKYQYVYFIMQCLAELLFSYDSCKVAFLSYSPKKKLQTPAKDSGNRFRMATLQFVFSDLLTFVTINPQSDSKFRNKMMLCNWAMTVIISLCADTCAPAPSKEISPDLVSVRKYVLEALGRAIKDIPSSDNISANYGRLLALSELCNRLLTVRFDAPPPNRKPTEILTHLAKVMIEKNFVATLTSSLSEIDLNYPHVRSLVTAVLKPLQYLTKVAIKMSHPGKGIQDKDDDSVADSSSSDEEEEFEGNRTETPDLYRNSSLGMYTGEMDTGQYSQDEDMEEDVGDTDEDVEMDFGDESGSEDTSNTDEDEEDEDDDEMEDAERASEDSWDEAVDEGEEGLVEAEEDDEENDGSLADEEGEEIIDDEDDEGDGELNWEDAEDEAEGLGGIRDEFDEEEETGVPVHIVHEEDEGDMESDEGHAMDNGFFNLENVLNFEQLVNAGGRDAGFVVSRRHRANLEEHMHVFGRPRNNVVPTPETTVHPLLLNTSSQNRLAPNQSRGSRQPQRIVGSGTASLLQTLDGVIGPGSYQVIQQIVSGHHRGAFHETFRLDVPAFVNMERAGVLPSRRGGMFSHAIRVERPSHGTGQRQGREFEPLLTIQRWTEETKILHGDFVAERVVKLANHVILALLPDAIEAAKEAKVREEEEAARVEQEKAKAEEEEKKALENASNSDQMETDSNRAPAKSSNQPETITESDATMSQAEDVQSQAAAQGQVEPSSNQTTNENSTADADTDMSDVHPATESQSPPAGNEANQAAESSTNTTTQPERVTVTIHGNIVDITDTGIDPDFLEALPDEMREEVLNQHVRDQRASRVERPPDSQISTEFLDALPPEIRAEIIQQEAMERARRQAEEVVPQGGPVEIDPATFIASLDPTLRQAVLMEQDEGFIASLPSHIIAEVEALRDDYRPRRRLATRPAGIRSSAVGVQGQLKAKPQHDAIQLLDKNGVAVLVRLLFFPKALRKSFLFKIFVNLCQNSKTRTELFNFLLSILQDGTGDLAAVDKSFAQMSVRSSKPQTPKSASKQKPNPDYLVALSLPASQMEAFPDLVAKKCLDALTYIVNANPHASLFFLTEHEMPAGLRKAASKKGKGKEKLAPQSHYPIVLLLGLLDRKALLRTPAIMDSVVNLLASVTKPLTELRDHSESTKTEASTLQQPDTVIPAQPVTLQTPADRTPATTLSPPAPAEPSQTAPEQPDGTSQPPAAATEPKIETVEEKVLLANPPQIPHAVLRLIVNILTVGECPAKTFQQSMNLIQHLSYISDARDVIAQELRAKAQEFGRVLIGDIDQLIQSFQPGQADALTSCISTKFSPASSTQAKLLRVLKTIEHMYSHKASGTSETDIQKKEQDVEKVQVIYESFNFSNLWRKLGDCLSIIGETPETEHIATVLLPLIESLMVVCQHVGPKASQTGATTRAIRGSMSPRSPSTARESMEELFISFTDSHRKLLNLMVRNNPSLMSGSFSLLVNNPRVLDFDNKRNFFSQQLHRRPADGREHRHTLQLNVRRARVFEDSFQHLQRKTGEQIKYGKLNVRFYDEEGVDAGGVTREWFQILARQMFDPNNALFQPCAADKQTYQPNKNSWVNPEHLSFFKFVGRVIGKAIYDGRLLDAYFARSLYRQLLGKPVDYKDVEWVDPEYYKSLCWILENDPTALDLTFSVEADEFGVNRIISLKEGGEHLPVTQENKREFVQLSAQYRLYSSIKDQIESLSSGFYEVIPKDLITIFNEQELELLISGTPDIDVDEWRAATDYVGYTSSDPNIVWWWRALKSFNRDERAKVLSFATGTSRVPLNGFTDLQGVQGVQRFSIHRAYGDNDRLPQAHTCFNQIDLPQYSSYEMLRQQLLLAIIEGGEGFAFS